MVVVWWGDGSPNILLALSTAMSHASASSSAVSGLASQSSGSPASSARSMDMSASSGPTAVEDELIASMATESFRMCFGLSTM